MNFNNFLGGIFKLSIVYFLFTFLYDLEFFFFSTTILVGHALKGFIGILNDYIYLKPLKLVLLLWLSLTGVEFFHYLLDFLF